MLPLFEPISFKDFSPTTSTRTPLDLLSSLAPPPSSVDHTNKATMKASAIAVLAATVAIDQTTAFAPSTGTRQVTSLSATSDRREVIGNIAKVFGGAIAVAADPAFAASNPALQTFKTGPKRGGDGTFKPGKGMRERMEFDELVSASNPALQTFKTGPKRGGDGTFKPGKGMRSRDFFDDLA